MQIKSVLVSSALLFSSLAMAGQTLTVTQTEQHTSYSTVDTVTLTGSAPPTGSFTPSIPPSQKPLTTIMSSLPPPYPSSVPTSFATGGLTTPGGNATAPTHSAPKGSGTTAPPSTATTNAAIGGFSGSVRIAAAVGIAAALVGSF